MTPSVSLREEVNDNILMTPEERKRVWGSAVSPLLRWGGETERLELRADLAASLSRYAGEEGLDANDSSVRFSPQYRLERSRWGGEVSWLRDATWRSELRETGRVLAQRERNVRTMDGFWEASLTERVSVQGQYQLTDVQYAEEGAGLFDYQTRVGSVDLTDDLSERDRAKVAFHLLQYRAPTARIRSIDAGFQAGITRLFSETFSATVSIGARGVITEQSFQETAIRERSRGVLGRLAVEKQFEAVHWRGGWSREVNPSGSGYLIESDHLFTAIEHEIGETVTVSLAADGYRSRALRSVLPSPESRSFRVEPTWRWSWTEQWSMAVSYRYARQRESGADAADANANAVIWTLLYEGPKRTGGIEGMSAE